MSRQLKIPGIANSGKLGSLAYHDSITFAVVLDGVLDSSAYLARETQVSASPQCSGGYFAHSSKIP